MSTTQSKPDHHRDDDKVGEPKGGGFDAPGTGRDDDKIGEPKGGGFDRSGS